MANSMKYLLAVALIASIASTAFAIQCYQCESLTNPRCGMNFESDDALKIDCGRIAPPRFLQTFFPVRNATGCMKKTLESVAGSPQIVRSCYFGDISNTQTGCQSDPSLPFVKQLSCNVCDSNFCNGASSSAPFAVVAMLLFLVGARIFS